MNLPEKYRQKIEEAIVDEIKKNYTNQVLGDSDVKEIADFVREGMNEVTDHTSLMAFLKELAFNWNMFYNVYLLEHGKVQRVKEKHTASDVAEMIEAGDTQQAVDTAQKVMK